MSGTVAGVDATEVHRRATVVNALVGSTAVPSSFDAPFDLPEPILAGGVTAASLTVSLSGGFAENVRTIAYIRAAVERHPQATLATSVEEIHAAKRDGLAAILLNFQNGTPIEDDLDHVGVFHQLGIRVFQLTYQRRNLIADGCGEPGDAGLSLFGRKVVAELNRVGMTIDLSHVGHRATMETIELSERPVSFTHVNMHAFNPIPRNKTDEQIKAVAERGGVIGINAIARLITADGPKHGATLDQYLDQVDHVVELTGGTDHVGIGLDINEGMTAESFAERRRGFLAQYPEIGGDFPFEHYYVSELFSMASMPRITEGLLRRGYAEADVEQVLGGNFLRLFADTWTPAA
jgi:membrane dipeptidase